MLAVAAKHEGRQYKSRDLWDKFWRDKDGNVVVWQWPNAWLIAWLVLILISFLFSPGNFVNTILWYASLAVLVVWAVLEAWKGVNYLRKSLGVIVLLMVVLALFKVGY